MFYPSTEFYLYLKLKIPLLDYAGDNDNSSIDERIRHGWFLLSSCLILFYAGLQTAE
jgi:hypothetical protein